MSALHALDYAVIAGYLTLIILLGAVFGRRQSRREYFAASGSMGVLAVGLSVMATLFSSNSFVMYPSAAYGSSWRVGLTLVSVTLAAPLVMWLFIPVYTRLNCQTAYEYLERRFDVSVRCLASGLFVVLRIAWMAAATYAASLVLSSVSGFEQRRVIVGLGAAAILYTMLGGMRAVMWTDVIQFLVFAITILVTLRLLASTTGGVSATVRAYLDGRDGMLFDFTPSLTLKYGSWAILLGIFLEALSAFGADQVAVQRYVAARSERTSQFAFLVNLAGMWLLIPSLLLIGAALHVHFSRHPQELAPVLARHLAQPAPEGLPAADRRRRPAAGKIGVPHAPYERRPERVAADMLRYGLQDQALPQFVRLHFPPGLTGLFLAALMAAIMSSVDSGIHSVTTALIVDFRDRLAPHWRPPLESQDVRLIRCLVVLVGAVAVTLACFVGSLGDVFDIGKKVTAAFGGPLLAVFVLAFFSQRAASRAVLLGALLAAGLTLALMYGFPEWFSVWHWPIGFALAIVLALAASPLLRQPSAKTPLTYREVMRG